MASMSAMKKYSGLVRTVKVSNVSLGASERDLKEFFSFSGDIEYVEMKSDNERSQIAYVTFKRFSRSRHCCSSFGNYIAAPASPLD
ncbi:SERINE/ARGININE-RICH SPLICING FACTOR [Salix purpurea]|uniref:SERINE/ARGININE-RICH SPLICING FACTOR n=1 Tax=Salix purpurea TaxID=77065 RepID=A0A9Q0TI74_SALPP|nr:SERINE/ARGININE-RICH SPLICING FACTOR [Salix purpurea]